MPDGRPDQQRDRRRRSTSSATSTSSTARSSIASSPTATPPRRSATLRCRSPRSPRQGRATELPGIGADHPGEGAGARRRGRDPRRGQAAGEVPARPGRDDAPARARAQARAAAVRGARRSTRSRRSRAAAEEQRIRTLKGFGPKAEESILAALDAAGRRRAAHPRVVLDRALAVGEQLVAALREHPAVGARRAGRLGPADDRQRQGPRRHRHRHRPARAGASGGGARARRDRRTRRETPASGCERTPGCRSTCGSSRPTSSATCSSTSPAPSSTTWRCATPAVRKGLHVSEYGVLDDATGETHRCATEAGGVRAARPGVHRARAARESRASSRPPRRGRCPSWSRSRTSGATCTATPRPPTERRRSRRWRSPRARPATSTSRSPITPRASASATRCRPTSCSRTSSGSAWPRSTGSSCSPAARSTSCPTASLDYDDELLAELDWVVASVHSSFRMPSEAMTERIVRAIEHPLVDVIGHLSGRKIERRPPYAVRCRARDRGGRADGHDAGDQRQSRPPRPERGQRSRGGGRGRADRDQLRRPPGAGLRGRALRRRHRAAGLADRSPGGQHQAMDRAPGDAQGRKA